MWTLFVITLLPQIDDAKVTRFREYESEKVCVAAQIKLEKTFEMNEVAVCIQVEKSNLK